MFIPCHPPQESIALLRADLFCACRTKPFKTRCSFYSVCSLLPLSLNSTAQLCVSNNLLPYLTIMISLLYSYHNYLGICRIHPGFLECAAILNSPIIKSFLSNFLILLIAHCCRVCVQRDKKHKVLVQLLSGS